ncbi:MAG: hypothetical protein KME05_12180 [Gloeocapsa sp. UFS-A4-WI-NPMV-4B04]|nr:hypothetical protein [Gloeocapsa sp. UFS-A4-WI-NPMV-4B04]
MTNNNVTNLSKQQQRALDPNFIKLAANDLVTTQLYKLQDMSEHEVRDAVAKEDKAVVDRQYGATASDEAKAAYHAAYKVAYDAAKWDDFDEFSPPQKRVILPFATVRANTDTEELGGYKIHEYERYGKSFVEFGERAKVGRHTERVVYYWLAKAGVVANLEPLILDGDTSKKAPDITVRAAKPNENGDYQWYSLEVKTTTLEYEKYNDDPNTFPSRIRVDSVKAYDQKRKTCTRNDAPLIGVVKVHSITGGVLFIPDSTRDQWEMKHQTNKWKTDTVYWADASCFRSFASLVAKLGGQLS